MTQQDILHRPFDIETHKKTFIDYLEVIIRPDGTIEYAVPSHMYKLMSVFEGGKYSVDQINEMFIQDMMGLAPIEWLCKKTGCISVWTKDFEGTPNEQQIEVLKQLASENLYTGTIPTPTTDIDLYSF